MPGSADRRSLEAALAATPTTIAEAVEAMRAIETSLAPADGVACFTRLYRAVTEAVDEALRPPAATFADPGFVTTLDLVFAELYFDALRGTLQAPPSVPRAWRPLVDARSRTDVAPIQFALAGMNAHINRDLPVALARTFERLGRSPQGRAEREDYRRVNGILVETEARVRADFATGPIAVLDRLLGDVDSAVAMWNVARARDAAWTNGETLWRLRDAPDVAAAYLQTLDRTVGFAGRGLLRPARPKVTAALAAAGRLLRRAAGRR